ncbi:hypothetical protein ACFWBS_43915 [Streptomyces mirabilis]
MVVQGEDLCGDALEERAHNTDVVGLDWAGERLQGRIYEIDGKDGTAER